MLGKIKRIICGMLISTILISSSSVCYAQTRKVTVKVKASKQAENFVNVRNFGAVGDGVTDDYASIVNAINAVKGTSKILYFPNGDYYCSKKIVVNDSCSFKGESREQTTLTFRDVTPNAADDVWLQRGMFTFYGSALSMSTMTFRYIADNETPYARSKTQASGTVSEGVLVSILKGDSINLENCWFWVGGKSNPSVTCMWMKAENSNISNVTVKGCRFENESRATVGGALWLSSHDNKDVKVSDVVITDCEMIKHANDEALALWGYNVTNVLVTNNDISYSGQQVQNDVLISFGMPNNKRIESLRDIHFTGNRIHINGKCIAAVKFQLLSDDSTIEFSDNVIDGNINKNTTFECVWFYKAGTVDFHDNIINVTGGKQTSFFKRKHDNNVIMKGNSFNRKSQ